MNRIAATTALAIALGVCALRADAAMPTDGGDLGRLHRDFFHAWRATGHELDRLAACARTADFDLAAESAVALAQTIHELPRFSADLAVHRRSAYLRETEDLRVLVDQVGAFARSHDATGLKSTVEQLRAGRQNLAQIVPPLWLSVAGTLKGRTQPGSRLVIE